MNIYPCVNIQFTLLSWNVMRSVVLGEINALCLSIFDNESMYWNRSIVGDTVSPERIIFLLKF